MMSRWKRIRWLAVLGGCAIAAVIAAVGWFSLEMPPARSPSADQAFAVLYDVHDLTEVGDGAATTTVPGSISGIGPLSPPGVIISRPPTSPAVKAQIANQLITLVTDTIHPIRGCKMGELWEGSYCSMDSYTLFSRAKITGASRTSSNSFGKTSLLRAFMTPPRESSPVTGCIG
jgi:hypothetical protein